MVCMKSSIYLFTERWCTKCVALCCCVLQCVAVCCCVLLCVAVSANMDVGMDKRTVRVNISHWRRYKPAILEAVKRVNLCPRLVEIAFSDALLMCSLQKIAADAAFKNRASRGFLCVTLLKSAHWFPDSCLKACPTQSSPGCAKDDGAPDHQGVDCCKINNKTNISCLSFYICMEMYMWIYVFMCENYICMYICIHVHISRAFMT